MPCSTPCKNCDRKGLPILFTRYAAAYSAQDTGMAALRQLQPMGNFQKQPGGVAMQTALYNVRMLRPGYLYIRFMHKMYRAPVWRGYVVHPHGYLAQFDISQPQEAKPHPACEMEIRGANMSLVWIEEAKDVLEFHYMFHPDPVDLAHLKNEVEPQRDKYMQKFDVAGWANGSTGQKDTCQPGQLNGQVVEFAALGDAKLRDAMEPQLYGLMGANAIERVWGDWEDQVYEEKPGYTAMGDYAGGTLEARTEIRKGLPYATVHGPRLKQIAGYLQDKQGAIVACEDAVGMSQELGHLQTEAQVGYAHWQASQASDFVAGVSNEWVYQSAVGAQGLMELVKKGAMQRTEARIKDWNENYRPAPTLYPDAATQARELERRRRAVETNQQRERESPSRTADAQYASLFDNVAAANILDAQRLAYEKQQTMMAQLGADQRGWLLSKSLYRTMGAYSAQDAKIHMPGGGASLSLQLAQCLSGTEGNPTGRKLLESLDLWGDNPLSRMLCFNSLTLQNTLKEVEAAQPPETTQPGAEASTPLADWVSEKIKPQAGRFGLGDKALGFTQEVPALADSQRLRKLAWPLHVASLMSVKMMQTVNALPVTKWEAQIVKYAALTGLSTGGSKVQEYLKTLAQADQDRLRNAQRGLEKGAHRASAAPHAPNARAAGIAAVLDVGQALLKGRQLQVRQDARTASEMVGNLLQGIGSVADWRAKAYEETVFRGVKGVDIFRTKPMQDSLDSLQAMKLKGLRVMAFKFLLPAAMVAAFWDGVDARASWQRSRFWLSAVQAAGVLGTAFTIAGTGVATFVGAGTILGFSGMVVAAILGLIGALLTLASVVTVMLLKEDDWVTWLRDNPLNNQRRGKKPIHDDLKDTLQKLANAQAAAA